MKKLHAYLGFGLLLTTANFSVSNAQAPVDEIEIVGDQRLVMEENIGFIQNISDIVELPSGNLIVLCDKSGSIYMYNNQGTQIRRFAVLQTY